jgi:hypothetical protein
MAAGKTVLYITPDGSDRNPGTIDKPLATLGRARDAVREFKRSVPKPVTLLFRGGTYYMSGPVVFGTEESGTDLQPITYAAYPGEKHTLSGGLRIDAKWQVYRDGIMKCSVPKSIDWERKLVVLGEGGWQTCLLDNPDGFFGTALSRNHREDNFL